VKRREDQKKREENDEQFRQWKKKKEAALRQKKKASTKQKALSEEKRISQKEEHARQLLQLRTAQKQWNKERSDLENRIVKAEEKWAAKNMKQIKLRHGQWSPPASPIAHVEPNPPRSQASVSNQGGNKSKRRTKQTVVKAPGKPESDNSQASNTQIVAQPANRTKKKKKQPRKNRKTEKERALKSTYC
jgi:hypothetical protein